MKLGDVFYWITEKAIGHDSRAKYHIYICDADAWNDNTFLLINKSPWGDELKITKVDYPFLDYDSYIGCNGVVTYTDTELAALDKNPVGQIRREDLKALFNILADPLAMEAKQAKRLCNALKAAF
jgi:hypothetical protein